MNTGVVLNKPRGLTSSVNHITKGIKMTDETQDTASPEPAAGGSPSKDARNMAMLAHLLGIFTFFVGALIIWLIKKDDDPFIDDQGKEALNFQITVGIIYVIGVVAWCLVIPPLIASATWIAAIVFSIIAAIKASEGKSYRYPFTLRLIK